LRCFGWCSLLAGGNEQGGSEDQQSFH
jgi:hypothetical protein